MSPVRRFLSRVLLACLLLALGCIAYSVIAGSSVGVVLALFVYLASTPFIAFWIADYPNS